MRVQEWQSVYEDEEEGDESSGEGSLQWRQREGWMGSDFCHSRNSAVRILQYSILAAPDSRSCDSFPSLVGVVRFSPAAESHKGLCHGGAACAVMDDAIGWMGFCVTGAVLPWSGYTVQIDTSLKRPITVGSALKIESRVVRKEKTRKFWIEAVLSDGVDGTIYAVGSGLFLLDAAYVTESS